MDDSTAEVEVEAKMPREVISEQKKSQLEELRDSKQV